MNRFIFGGNDIYLIHTLTNGFEVMFSKNPPGFHTTLTQEVYEHILTHIPGNYVAGQVARCAGIARSTLIGWLKKGGEHIETGQNTIFAQLTLKFDQIRGQEIKDMIADIRGRKKQWQACWELLKVVCREDFGQDSDEYKELLAMYHQLNDSFKQYIDRPIYGGISNAKAKGKEAKERTQTGNEKEE